MIPPPACEFRRSVELDVPVAEAYAFHADPRNVTKISPGWQTVRVLKASADAKAGQEFEIEIRLFGVLPMHWRGVWRTAEFPGLLVDEALASPFAFWQHRHSFEPLGAERTRMTDHVFYQFPGGWLGKWFGETVGRLQFHFMFADRQARTRRALRAQHLA